MCTAAELLGQELRALRDRGCRDFDWAWRVALASAVEHAAGEDALEDVQWRASWVPILEGCRDTYRSAYLRLDDQPIGRWCEWCGDPIAEGRRRNARFCPGHDCYNAHHRAARREELGTPLFCAVCGGSMLCCRAGMKGCSWRCSKKLADRARYLARCEREGRPAPLTHCAVCGVSIEHRKSTAKTCSRVCLRALGRERYRRYERERYRLRRLARKAAIVVELPRVPDALPLAA